MKTKSFLKAIKFACLPTLSLLALLFFGFFSISKTVDFISSDNPWAIFLRVFMVLAEVALVTYMYLEYAKKEAKEEEKRIAEEAKEEKKKNS